MRLYEIVMETESGEIKKIKVYAASNRMARKQANGVVYSCKEVEVKPVDIDEVGAALFANNFPAEQIEYILNIIEAGLPKADEKSADN